MIKVVNLIVDAYLKISKVDIVIYTGVPWPINMKDLRSDCRISVLAVDSNPIHENQSFILAVRNVLKSCAKVIKAQNDVFNKGLRKGSANFVVEFINLEINQLNLLFY